ncbi:MAG TPA: SDR family oxidoreductase [Bryobacteraceae bacterium]|nr:SDR family oxidoreductase [Bryobacteraceae bacterium]
MVQSPVMGRLDKKVALITGGSSGIGRAAVLAFIREGARVVFAARGKERGEETLREAESAGGEAMFISVDVSQSEQVRQLVAAGVDRFGRLDCAFNNAASATGAFHLTADFTEEQFDKSMALDLKSVWLCMKQEIGQMLSQEPPGGAIVNTSSVNGLGGSPGGSLYSAAKAGILALTKSAAREYAPRGIRINALVPGGFRTPMLESVFERASAGDAAKRAAIERQYADFTAVGRIGNAEEAAEAVVWLCSHAASYVIGHSLIVDGGMSAPFR